MQKSGSPRLVKFRQWKRAHLIHGLLYTVNWNMACTHFTHELMYTVNWNMACTHFTHELMYTVHWNMACTHFTHELMYTVNWNMALHQNESFLFTSLIVDELLNKFRFLKWWLIKEISVWHDVSFQYQTNAACFDWFSLSHFQVWSTWIHMYYSYYTHTLYGTVTSQAST